MVVRVCHVCMETVVPSVKEDIKAFEKKPLENLHDICAKWKIWNAANSDTKRHAHSWVSFPAGLASVPTLESRLIFVKTFWNHCKVTMPKSMKPSSVRHHVWWRALCMRLTWAMATFSPWRELNPLPWAKPDYIVLALNRIWHYIGLALCLIRSTGPAGFFTSGSSTAGTAGTKTPMGLLVDRKACWKLGKKNCSCNNSSNPSKGIYWAPHPALWAFPLPHARCLNHVLRFSLTSLTSSGMGTCRRYLCNPCVPYFRVLLE